CKRPRQCRTCRAKRVTNWLSSSKLDQRAKRSCLPMSNRTSSRLAESSSRLLEIRRHHRRQTKSNFRRIKSRRREWRNWSNRAVLPDAAAVGLARAVLMTKRHGRVSKKAKSKRAARTKKRRQAHRRGQEREGLSAAFVAIRV